MTRRAKRGQPPALRVGRIQHQALSLRHDAARTKAQTDRKSETDRQPRHVAYHQRCEEARQGYGDDTEHDPEDDSLLQQQREPRQIRDPEACGRAGRQE
jgi:hypothetical protein